MRENDTFKDYFGQIKSRESINDYLKKKITNRAGLVLEQTRHKKLDPEFPEHQAFILAGHKKLRQLFEAHEEMLKEPLPETPPWAAAEALRDMVLYYPSAVSSFLLKYPGFAMNLCYRIVQELQDKPIEKDARKSTGDKIKVVSDGTGAAAAGVAETTGAAIPGIGIFVSGGKMTYDKYQKTRYMSFLRKISEGMYLDQRVANAKRLKAVVVYQNGVEDHSRSIDDGRKMSWPASWESTYLDCGESSE